MSRRDAWFWTLLLLAILNTANALSMLIDPSRWYRDLPAAVPDFGPYNEHFVRDLGCAFLTVTFVLVWAALRPAVRFPLVATAAFFLVGHAVLHVYDTARGFVEADHWWIDFPGVYLPALVLAAMTILLWRQNGAAAGRSPSSG